MIGIIIFGLILLFSMFVDTYLIKMLLSTIKEGKQGKEVRQLKTNLWFGIIVWSMSIIFSGAATYICVMFSIGLL